MAPPPPKRKRLDKPAYDDADRSNQRPASYSQQPGDMPNNYGGHSSYYGRGDSRAATNPSRGAYEARRPTRGGRSARGSGRGRGGNLANSVGPGRPQTNPQGSTADDRPSSANAQGTRNAEPMDGVAPTPPPPSSTTPAPPPRTQPVPPAPRPPPPPKADREYQTLTTEVIQNWDSAGRQTVMKQWQQVATAQDLPKASEIYMELIDSGLDQRLEATEAGKTIHLLLEEHTPEDFSEDARLIFLDTLCVLADSDCAHPYMVSLVSATGISFDLMRTVLDEPQLRALGLVRETFGKMFIRKQTQAIYRQSNYNLLREESEGWSKLMTELHTVASQEDLPDGIEDQTLKNIFALIGTFDLDAGRALDVILDVFANMLVKKDRFFVKLLRASPYWPQPSSGVGIDDHCGFTLPLWASPNHPSCELTAHEAAQLAESRLQRDTAFWSDARKDQTKAWFRLGGRKLVNNAIMNYETSVDLQGLTKNQVSDTHWIRTTGTNPPSGSYVAAQLLGQKLRHYAESPRSKDDELPTNLMRMTALLIKIGFISIRDLYPHLSPSDDDMPAVKAKQTQKNEEQERTKRPGGGELNALARAGALVDDTVPPPQQARLRVAETRSGTPSRTDDSHGAKENGAAEVIPEAHNQKVELLKSLMLLGAIPDVLFILSQFPWLIDAFPEVADYNNRILHQCLSDVYSSVDPTSKRTASDSDADVALIPSANQSALPKGKVRLTSLRNPRPRRWMDRDENDASGQESGNLPMQFFWEDWVNDVPLCRTVDDVFTLCDTYLNVSGVKVGRDPLLVSKLARIGKHSLSEDKSDPNKERWARLLKRIICPALSLTQANAGVTEDVWNLLKLYDAEIRFSIYAEWFQGPTSRVVDVAAAFGTTRAWTKHVLKRISKDDDLKKVGRELGKLTYSSPGVAFEVCLNQIESYDNMIGVVVECGQFISSLAFDVLPFTIMSFLGRQGRSRVSQTGFTANKWLQSLSTFIGQVYARHNLMEPVLILRYILDQIRHNSFPDLRILRDLVSNMAGITPDTNFSQSQLVTMGGGDFLRRLTLEMLDDARYARERSGRRLMYHLKHYNLAGPLMIAVSRLRQTGVFTQDIDDIKILGETIDEALTVQAQFVQLLNHYLEPVDFDKHVPSVAELVSDFGLSVDMAFTIHRRSLTQKMIQYDSEHKTSNTKTTKPSDSVNHATDGDVKMPDWEEKGAAEAASVISSDGKPVAQDDTVVKAAVDDEAAATNGPTLASEATTPWHPVLEEVMAALEPSLSDELKSNTGVHFLTTFWQLDLPAISPTPKTYEQTIAQKKATMQRSIPNTRDTNERFKAEAEKKKAKEDHDRLVSEANTHFEKIFKPTRYRLRREKDHWFKGFQNKADELHMSLLQDCFIPRVCLSAVDAVFAYKMLFEMHTLGTPNFRTGKLLGNLFSQRGLTNLLFQFTHKQADNFGHFLFGVLEVLGEWHKERKTFEMRAHGGSKDLLGFASRIGPTGKPEVFLEYEEFRRALRRWHNNLFMALKSCLASSEYMSVRNGIQLITRILTVFPAIEYMGNGLTKELTTIADREKGKRDDLSVAARSAYGQLKSQQKRWMSVQDFSINEPGQQNAAAVQASKDSAGPEGEPKPEQAVQSQNADGSGQLRATAPDFRPEERSRLGNEDGEIQDVKMQDAADAASSNSLPINSKGPEASTAKPETKLPPSPQLRTGRSDAEPRPSNALKRPSLDANLDGGESPSSNKRFRSDDYGQDPRHDPAAPPRHRGVDRAPPRRSGNYHQSDGGDTRGMPPPSMPKSDRAPPRAPDGPLGQRGDQMGYGRSNHDHPVSHGSGDYSHNRQSRHEYPPSGPDRRHSGSNTQALNYPDRADTPGRSNRPTRGPDPRRSESASAPSTPTSDSNAIPLGRPSHMDPMAAQRPPPPQMSRAPPGMDQPGYPRRQDPGRPGGPAGPNSNQRPAGPYNAPPTRLSDASQPQYDDYSSGRNSRGAGPPASPVDPQGPAVNPARAALIQDNGVQTGGRPPRDEGRYGPDVGRNLQHRGSPSHGMPANDFGGGMRTRNGGMPPDGPPSRHHREERPDLISRSDPNTPRRDERMRDERQDHMGRNDGSNVRREDRNRGREDYDMDPRAATYQRDPSRDTRGPAEPSRPPRGGGASSGSYDEPLLRANELPPRRGGPPRDLISHNPVPMHDSDRPPVRERDPGARDRRPDDRGPYSRPDDSGPPRGGPRGGPPPRRGGPGPVLDSRMDVRRSGDFQGGPRGERRDVMNGAGGAGGSERRKRTWGERNEDDMAGEAKRPARR